MESTLTNPRQTKADHFIPLV